MCPAYITDATSTFLCCASAFEADFAKIFLRFFQLTSVIARGLHYHLFSRPRRRQTPLFGDLEAVMSRECHSGCPVVLRVLLLEPMSTCRHSKDV